MSINIEGLTTEQFRIADLLWRCQTSAQVDAVILLFGVNAIVVRDMMIAAQLDEFAETQLASQVLDQFRI